MLAHADQLLSAMAGSTIATNTFKCIKVKKKNDEAQGDLATTSGILRRPESAVGQLKVTKKWSFTCLIHQSFMKIFHGRISFSLKHLPTSLSVSEYKHFGDKDDAGGEVGGKAFLIDLQHTSSSTGK